MSLDVDQVRRRFARAARHYDATAVLQHEVQAALLERVREVVTTATRVLDVGAGTGSGSAALRKHFAKAEVIALDLALPMLRQARRQLGWWRPFRRVCGDARALPIQDQSLDLIYSNLCLQWCDDLQPVFAEFRRVLKPGGWLLFTSFGPDTLTELRQSWAAVDAHPHVNQFQDLHDVGDALMAQGFRDPMLDVERLTLTYTDALTLMRELKAIGASNADQRRCRGLTGRHQLQAVLARYEAFRDPEQRLPASYEVIFAQAQAPASTQPRRSAEGEIASVSVASLRSGLQQLRDKKK
ncbi:MAG: malonyl-[acyl-carrier protein] O-methyltransferase BioC [Lysobacterales bacterium CG02_land_8_20_14_3_00_62_12]|nr:MAG: malonyl-[acyl-carrier protein] O-methyltransferase BioC [Xanthomonadales bacterium CG02_land_8_20_14_3_00_62_12]